MHFESDTNNLEYRYNEVQNLLQDLKHLSDLETADLQSFVRTLDSLATELRGAKTVRLLDTLNSIASQVSEVAISRENIRFTHYTDRKPLLDRIATAVQLYTRADLVTLYEISTGGNRPKAHPGIAGQLNDPTSMSTEMHLSDVVFGLMEAVEPHYTIDSKNDPVLSAGRNDINRPRFVLRENILSTIAAPVRYNDQLEGLLFINYRQIQEFNAGQKDDIRELVRVVASTMHNIRFYRRAVEYNQQLEILLTVFSELARKATGTRNEMLNVICKGAVDVVGTSRGAIVFWDESGTTGQVVSEYRSHKNIDSFLGRRLFGNTSFQERVLRGDIVPISNIEDSNQITEDERAYFKAGGIKSTLVVPITHNNKVIASIGIDETDHIKYFTDEEKQLCRILANQAAIVLN
ncbi:MAG: GAF domain-containing protein [Caldilineaceae bacterium]